MNQNCDQQLLVAKVFYSNKEISCYVILLYILFPIEEDFPRKQVSNYFYNEKTSLIIPTPLL